MQRNAGFWRNVAVIACAHIVAFVALARWGGASERAKAKEIVWLDAASAGNRASAIDAAIANEVDSPPPSAAPEESEADESSEESAPLAAKSQIDLPIPIPSPTSSAVPTPAGTPVPDSTPNSTATPKPKPKPSPKAESKAKPNTLGKTHHRSGSTESRSASVKASPAPTSKRITAALVSSNSNNDKLLAAERAKKQGSADSGRESSGTGGGGASRPSEFAWYGSMLHDRFYSAWVQPTSAVPSGAKIATLVKIRIEKDGHVSAFTIVAPSGNVVVDESVSEVAKHVTQVDAPPRGIAGSREHYDVNINFEVAN